ncbi:MAG: HNH endonuclease [Patescibacteria group bacterium]|nr:HNH endonuclease [Patescibacteria group bacterium]
MHQVLKAKRRTRQGQAIGGPPTEEPIDPPAASSGLQASVLVLNRQYMAVHVVTARRAFGLLYRDLAEVIHADQGGFGTYTFHSWREVSELLAEEKHPHDDWIRTVSFEIRVPRVIRLLDFDRAPRQRLALNRRAVLARDGHVCQYCGRRLPTHQLSIDHVIPRSRGGQTAWENVVCACLACNIRKGGRTPKEAKMLLMRHPERPKRNPVLLLKLRNPKYASWHAWVEGVLWDVGAAD